MSDLLRLTVVLWMRLCREGMLLRALAWPGLLSAGALVGTALIVGVLRGTPVVAVAPGPWAVEMAERGVRVLEADDPEEAFADNDAEFAMVARPYGAEVMTRGPGSQSRAVELAAREVVGANWRMIDPEGQEEPPRIGATTRAISALVVVLFTLYGVVLGAAALFRDRQEGILESELSMPVPFWFHPAARLLSMGSALVISLLLTLLLLDGLLGMQALAAWMVHGSAATLSGAALGLGFTAWSRGDSFSGPLSRALVLVMGTMSFGLFVHKVGISLPIASVGALVIGGGPGPGPVVGAVVLCGLACLTFSARGLH